jgi:hypothetical protein
MEEMLDGIQATLAEHARWSAAAAEREQAAEAALVARARELS